MRSFFFIILALLFLGSAAYLGYKYLYDPAEDVIPSTQQPAKTPTMWALQLVRDVERGEILEKGQLQWKPLANGQGGDHLLTRKDTDLADWQGAAFARALTKGVFVQEMDLVRPTEANYLKTLLGEGMRARPVAIDNLGDFSSLRPGDHVDLVLTYVAPNHAARSGETIVKTILEDIRVIGLEQAEGKKPSDTLTLALSPKEVELASMAEAVGKLQISLHGGLMSKNTDMPHEKSAFSASDLFPGLKPKPVAIVQDQSRNVRIMRGGDTSVVTLKPAVIE